MLTPAEYPVVVRIHTAFGPECAEKAAADERSRLEKRLRSGCPPCPVTLLDGFRQLRETSTSDNARGVSIE
jgi:hypothetical protein